MHSALLKEIDGTVVLEMPADVLEALDLHAGESVNVRIEDGALAFSARLNDDPSLEEMLAECDFSIPPSAEEVEWNHAPRVGRETV